MDLTLLGISGVCMLVFLLFLGIQIGVAMAITGLLGTYILTGSFNMAIQLLTTTPYATTAVFEFTILPLFVLMGLLATNAGLSHSAFDAAFKWLGRLPGGLAVATTAANALFGACTGSSVVSCAVFTRISLPSMREHDYDKKFACGTIAAAGMLGMLIPPSALMVVYGILTQMSIGKLLIAGVGPGILLTAVFSAGIVALAYFKPHLAPPAREHYSWKEKFRSLAGIWGIAAIMFGIIAGMYGGLFTPTEAGAAGAFGALILALVSKKLSWKSFFNALTESSRTTGLIFFILIGAMIFARFLTLTQLPNNFARFVTESGFTPEIIISLFLIMYIVMGMFLDSISMMSITLPIVHPIIVELGVDPLYFALLVIMSIEIGLLTPPIGLNVYTVQSAAKQIPEGKDIVLQDIFKGIFPFFILSLLTLVLLFYFPSIITFLPNTMFTR